MTKKILLIAMLLITSTLVYSQCKVKTKGMRFSIVKHRVPLEIELITKPTMLFKKNSISADNFFAKTTDGEYYFIISYWRHHGKRHELHKETPGIFYLEDGEELTLKPEGEIKGVKTISTFNIYIYYKITKEQIKKLASNNILSLRIYFRSEKDIRNTFEDDLGRYFEVEIHSDKNKAYVIDAANCILQH